MNKKLPAREFSTISDLLMHLNDPTSKEEYYLKVGVLSYNLVAKISQETALEVVGFTLLLDRSGIQHTLKRHGVANATSELAQGQIPIENADFESLVTWLPSPDSVCAGQPRLGNKQPCVEFHHAHFSGRMVAVLEYRPRHKKLALVTMYKKRPTA